MLHNTRHGPLPRKPHPKITRPGKRKRMTLICALRCESYVSSLFPSPAVVICADSQETAGDFRVEVQKIKPIDAGAYELIIGGAGNIAGLIDGQADVIERNVKTWPTGLSEQEAQARLERVLIGYNARQVQHYPVTDDKDPEYKVLSFLVCVRDKATSGIYLWKTEATTIRTVTDYALVGWQEAAYHYHLKWLYRQGMPAFQVALLAIQLLKIAEDNLYIGGPIKLITVNREGMDEWPAESVRLVEERVKRFNAAVSGLFLTFPALATSEEEFTAFLKDLTDAIRQFRGQQLTMTGDFREQYHAGLRWEQKMDAIEMEERRRREAAMPSDSETSEGQP
jgi:hypothetical protein